MQTELTKRYRFHRAFARPSRATTSSTFRANLAELLLGKWDVSSNVNTANAATDHKDSCLFQLLHHFNGDLTTEDTWDHWCPGEDCCKDADDSLRKASTLTGQCDFICLCLCRFSLLTDGRDCRILSESFYLVMSCCIYCLINNFILISIMFLQTVMFVTHDVCLE